MGNQERRRPTTPYGEARISIIVDGIFDKTKRSRRQFLISLAVAGLGVATFVATGGVIYLNKIEQEKRNQQKEEISKTEVFRRDGIRQRADAYSERLLQEFMKPGLPIDVYFSEFSGSFDSTQGFKIDTFVTPIKIGGLS